MATETVPSAAASAAPPDPASGAAVVLAPSGRFFVRSVPVTLPATATEVAAQVELALETLSPFPVAQLYHGHLWREGATEVLVFAAYRRRFSPEDLDGWEDAEWVVPELAVAATLPGETGLTLLLSAPGACCGLHWTVAGGLPSHAVVEPIASEATPEEVARASEVVRTRLPAAARTLEWTAPPSVVPEGDARDMRVTAGDRNWRVPAAAVAAMDVRDKADLAALQRARARDVGLWRGFLGLLVALVVLGVVELSQVALGAWQAGRRAKVEEQRPAVEAIMAAQSLANRINELSTKRLRPFEMIGLVQAKPPSIYFLSVATSGLYTLEIQAQTGLPGDVDVYVSALRANPAFSSIDVPEQRSRDGVTLFRLVVVFKPESLTPAEPPRP
jgi:hypothetical protein